MLKLILVDDDLSDLNLLEDKLKNYSHLAKVVSVCSTVPEAVKSIHHNQPDIVFTDIEMPGISGLQLLDFFNADKIDFELVFTTSHSEYAIRAFQLSAIDYLLKPVDGALLQKTMEKVLKKQNYKALERRALLKQNLAGSQAKRIALPYTGGVNFVDIADIIFLKADNVYTDLYSATSPMLTISKPLKEFEKLLPPAQFFRCHRSYIINLSAVREYVTVSGGEIVMKNNAVIPLARDRKEEFFATWKSMKL